MERALGRIIPWVFWRVKGPGVREDGQPVKGWTKAWISACVKAGLGQEIRDDEGRLIKRVAHRLRHDFRRTAVRNLERADVPRSAAMAMVGHKTEAIYRRFAITDETMLREAGDKLSVLHREQRSTMPVTKVVSGSFGGTK